MSNEFKREERYIVVKIKDALAVASDEGVTAKDAILDFIKAWGISTCKGLVIEKDWPEYEPTWAAIERRVTGHAGAGFKPGFVEQEGDCEKWAAYIDDESHRNANRSAWYSRIRVLGDNKQDAEALRERVLAALNDAPAPVVWNGEGLPPVGLDVEWKQGSNHEWVRAKVIAYFRHEAWISVNGDNPFTIGNPGGFRPIRTPEQIAADKRKNAIEEMVSTSPMLDKGWARKVCTALYDAGYRKQVAK